VISLELKPWQEIATATISDALDYLGIAGQSLGISPLDRTFKAVGRAFTIRMSPVGRVHGTVGDYIDDVPPGDVVVIDNQGRLDVTVWGDLLTTAANELGVAGTVIHGVCRDTSSILGLNYPVFSRGVYMRTGKDRVQAEVYNEPVSLGEVRVTPGDLIVADADGVLVIPKEEEETVLEITQRISTREEQIRAAVLEGTRLDRARQEFRYHDLQRPN
jgi:regulator of RNase E activity RraA